jgi:sugar lactone lactonase YvrE
VLLHHSSQRNPTPYLTLAVACYFVATPLSRGALGDDHEDLPPSHSVAPESYATGFAFAEGPAFDTQGSLFVVNYRRYGTIGRITRDEAASVWCDLTEIAAFEGRQPQANGLKVDRFDRVIVADAGAGRLLRIAPNGKTVEILADRFEDTRFSAINDVSLDAATNIYFTDPGGSSLENPIGAVYRYEAATRKVSRISNDLAFPNGIAVTPDQKHLCVAESQRYRILIYDMDGQSMGNRRVLIELLPKTSRRFEAASTIRTVWSSTNKEDCSSPCGRAVSLTWSTYHREGC